MLTSTTRRAVSRVLAAIGIVAASTAGGALVAPDATVTPVHAADCLKPEITFFGYGRVFLDGPATYTVLAKNPNPSGTCNDGLEVEVAFSKTANPIKRNGGEPGATCTSSRRTGFAYVERCVNANLSGGESHSVWFEVEGLVLGERLVATIKPMRGNYATATYRPGEKGSDEIVIQAAMAPTPTPAPQAPGGGAVPPPGGADPAPKPAPKPQGLRAASPAVGLNATGERVTTIQYLLREHGQDVAVDGDFGPQTEAAVIAFQEANNVLPANGTVGAATWDALWVTVQQGSQGEAVSAVQQQLAARGKDVAVDGDFGPQTDAAVKAFQKEKSLPEDGIVGPQTWQALVAAD